MKDGAGVAENQLLHRLFFTSSPCITTFCKSLIINNNSPRTCVQRVSETFAVKVVQNAITGMVQRCSGCARMASIPRSSWHTVVLPTPIVPPIRYIVLISLCSRHEILLQKSYKLQQRFPVWYPPRTVGKRRMARWSRQSCRWGYSAPEFHQWRYDICKRTLMFRCAGTGDGSGKKVVWYLFCRVAEDTVIVYNIL